MWRKLKKQWSEFRRGRPGECFKAAYRRRKESRASLVGRVIAVVGAIVAIVLGVFFSLVPGVPGFVFCFAGAILLASESFVVARFFDWSEVKLRAAWARIRGKPKRKALHAES